jgi:hypothetical protein
MKGGIFPAAEVRLVEVRKRKTSACDLRARHIYFMWFRESLQLKVVQIWNRASVGSVRTNTDTLLQPPHTDTLASKQASKKTNNRLQKTDLNPVTENNRLHKPE